MFFRELKPYLLSLVTQDASSPSNRVDGKFEPAFVSNPSTIKNIFNPTRAHID
jgi:hypothetical protein